MKELYIEIPVEGYCTFEQACEYLAFGREPTPHLIDHSNVGKRRSKSRDKQYIRLMTKVASTLCNMLKQGDITTIRTLKSYRQKRIQSIRPNFWKNITTEHIFRGTSLCEDAMVNLEQMKAIAPVKQYKVTLDKDGWICINDGNIITKIHKTYPGHKNYEWMRFYFDHPNEVVSRQDVIKHFENTKYKYADGDKIDQCLFVAFKGQECLRHLCFPICNKKEICCTPVFTITDALVF